MKKIYEKPEITENAYAQFENVLTWGCSKMFTDPPPAFADCEGRDEWSGAPYSGHTDFPCAHGEGPHNIPS